MSFRMKVYCIALILAVIGTNAVPIEEVKVAKTNFGEAVNYKLKLFRDAFACHYHGNITLIPGIIPPRETRFKDLSGYDPNS